MVLHQRLRRLTKARRPTVGANRQASRLAGDGAWLGARAEGPSNAVGHQPNMAGRWEGWKTLAGVLEAIALLGGFGEGLGANPKGQTNQNVMVND
ncbi:MAG TPA: hypothetical protein VED02_06120 [Methyloceanibacter sp.]|nr:hypothetical protein [Methyloceanibacter sp.]